MSPSESGGRPGSDIGPALMLRGLRARSLLWLRRPLLNLSSISTADRPWTSLLLLALLSAAPSPSPPPPDSFSLARNSSNLQSQTEGGGIGRGKKGTKTARRFVTFATSTSGIGKATLSHVQPLVILAADVALQIVVHRETRRLLPLLTLLTLLPLLVVPAETAPAVLPPADFGPAGGSTTAGGGGGCRTGGTATATRTSSTTRRTAASATGGNSNGRRRAAGQIGEHEGLRRGGGVADDGDELIDGVRDRVHHRPDDGPEDA